MEEKTKKCKICKSKGMVESKKYKSKCLYCKGKGYRNSSYGIDK